MTQRTKWLLVGVGLLAALNLWRWWPGGSISSPFARAGKVAAGDLVLHQAAAFNKPASGGRDLFYAKAGRFAHARLPRKVPARRRVTPPASKQSEQDNALRTMSEYRLAAVAMRGEQRQAMLLRGDQVHTVTTGDTVENRYAIGEITPQSLTLRDRKTRASVTLRLQE